jgi:hypothetical protein
LYNLPEKQTLTNIIRRFFMNRFIFVFGLIILVSLASLSLAGIPKMINYQGMLTDDSGTPLTGSYNLTFKIWTDTTGGSSLWTETQNGVQVQNGLFNVILGRLTTLNLSFDQQYWLEVGVGGETMPRIRFTSVGYAYRAQKADTSDNASKLQGKDTTALDGRYVNEGQTNSISTGMIQDYTIVRTDVASNFKAPYADTADYAKAAPVAPTGGGWTDDGANVRLTTSTDNVGIGITSPGAKLHVANSSSGYGMLRIENSNTGDNEASIGFKEGSDAPYADIWVAGVGPWSNPNDFVIGRSTAKFLITPDGNVGIGTTNPAYKLDVRGNRIQLKEDATGDSIAMRTDGTAVDLSFGGANLYFQSSTAGEHILLNPTTNSYVGIGTTTPGTKLDVSSSSGTAIRATVTGAGGWGVDASAKEGGAHITDSDGSGNAYIAHGHTGVEAYGNDQGGYFQDADNGAYAHVGYGNRGIDAGGTEAGGHFVNGLGDGEAYLGYRLSTLNIGVQGKGSTYGGYFESPNTGGGFDNTSSSGWAWVAWGTKKITGGGEVSFVQNHPLNKDQVIIYSAPEGDEVATYTRGTTRLVNGEALVKLGETFKWVTNPDIGLTAHLTPRGDCKGLYVASLSTSEIVVKELQGGTSDVTFDYLVYGLRIGFEEVSVVHEKPREAYIPSMAIYHELYNKYPQLRHFNALERFREMYSQIGKPFNLGASQALRDAIHEFDPAIDKLPEPEKH